MDKIRLTNEIISKIKKEAFELTHRLMGGDLKAVILYGSCARGDFAEDSDVDIALLTRCNRKEGKYGWTERLNFSWRHRDCWRKNLINQQITELYMPLRKV